MNVSIFKTIKIILHKLFYDWPKTLICLVTVRDWLHCWGPLTSPPRTETTRISGNAPVSEWKEWWKRGL